MARQTSRTRKLAGVTRWTSRNFIDSQLRDARRVGEPDGGRGGRLAPFAITVVDSMAFQSATTFAALSTEASGAINQSFLLRIISSSLFCDEVRISIPWTYTRETTAKTTTSSEVFFALSWRLRPWSRKALKPR